jgi:hypothetical protein
MANFVKRHEELKEECAQYIISFLEQNGNRFEFISQDEIESDDFDCYVWDLPQVNFVGKHGYLYNYGITSVTLERDNLWFNGVIVFSDEGSDHSFSESEIELGDLCACADLLIVKN